MDGLNLGAMRLRRHVMAARSGDRSLATRPNVIWTMDFVSDSLFHGRRFRLVTGVAAYTLECLAIHVNKGIMGQQVVDVTDWLLLKRGLPPNKIRLDNGPEFISKALDYWAYINRVTQDFSRSGKSIDNAFVELFNCRPSDEYLNRHWFLNLEDARGKIEGT